VDGYYLGDPEKVAQAAQAVAKQTGYQGRRLGQTI
jgi:hypothetical protein